MSPVRPSRGEIDFLEDEPPVPNAEEPARLDPFRPAGRQGETRRRRPGRARRGRSPAPRPAARRENRDSASRPEGRAASGGSPASELLSSAVSTDGAPPRAETRESGATVVGAKRMTSPAPHAPPRPSGASQSVVIVPGRDVERLQLPRREEADRLRIGRPEGEAGVLRPAHRPGLRRRQRPQPEDDVPVLAERREGQCPPVRRDRHREGQRGLLGRRDVEPEDLRR